MIDWWNVFYNALWIIGLAIIVTAFSYNDWQAYQSGIKLRSQLKAVAFQLPLSIGLMLVSLGLALLVAAWWERLLWLVFAGLFMFQGWQSHRAG